LKRFVPLFLVALLPAFAQERDVTGSFHKILDADWQHYSSRTRNLHPLRATAVTTTGGPI
jgi:hypothetical protein